MKNIIINIADWYNNLSESNRDFLATIYRIFLYFVFVIIAFTTVLTVMKILIIIAEFINPFGLTE